MPLAVCLADAGDTEELSKTATTDEKVTALAAAAFYGNADGVEKLLKMKVEVNSFPSSHSGLHSHATALHQAVSSGSLACVESLVKAGASLNIKDRIYDSTPLGWAEFLESDTLDKVYKTNYQQIRKYLDSFK